MMYFSPEVVIGIIVLHFIADFVYQSDWMATNKSKNNIALLTHVLVYTAVLAIGGAIIAPDNLQKIVLPWILVNGALHFVTDFCTSRVTSKLWQANERHWFFVMIGFDQCIHYSCLFYSYSWIAGQAQIYAN